MRGRGSLAVAVTCATLGLGVVGCGSSGPTKAQFVARANAICESSLERERARSGDLTATTQVIDAQARALAALPEPAADRALLRRFLAAEQRFTREWNTFAAVAGAGTNSPQVVAAIKALGANPVLRLATRYGLVDCSTAPATVGSGPAPG